MPEKNGKPDTKSVGPTTSGAATPRPPAPKVSKPASEEKAVARVGVAKSAKVEQSKPIPIPTPKGKSVTTGAKESKLGGVSKSPKQPSDQPRGKRPRIEKAPLDDDLDEEAEEFDGTEEEAMEQDHLDQQAGPETLDETDEELIDVATKMDESKTEHIAMLQEGARVLISNTVGSMTDYLEALGIDIDSDDTTKYVAKLLVSLLNGLHKINHKKEEGEKAKRVAGVWNTKKVMAFLEEMQDSI